MFHSVQGIDGPAACQQDRKTFEIMRASQLQAWNQETAESYLDDLQRAKATGRNLMTEKYARMMEYTSPCEFRRIAPNVPALDVEAESIIERLSEISVRWMEELAAKYPHVGAQGRPIRNSGDNAHTPSFETYNRGELGTYSVKTLAAARRPLSADGGRGRERGRGHPAEHGGTAGLRFTATTRRSRAEGAVVERAQGRPAGAETRLLARGPAA